MLDDVIDYLLDSPDLVVLDCCVDGRLRVGFGGMMLGPVEEGVLRLEQLAVLLI